MAKKEKVTAENLKVVLWETLKALRSNKMHPTKAMAVATQSKEILRIVKTQLQISELSKRAIPNSIIEFSEKDSFSV